MKNIYRYEKPNTFGSIVQFAGIACMFGGMLIGDIVFGQIIIGFFVGFAAFIALIVAYIRKTGVWYENST